MQTLFHIVDRAVWDAVDGEYAPESLRSEGFVHCSFRDQVAGTLSRHYPDASGLVVVEFDPDLLGTDIVVEDTSGHGVHPHVYAPLPKTAAVAVHDPAIF